MENGLFRSCDVKNLSGGFSKKELGFGIGGWGGVRYKVIRTPKGKTLSNNNKKKSKAKKKK